MEVGVAVVDTHYGVSRLLPAVEVRVFTHAHVSTITYRVDIYQTGFVQIPEKFGNSRNLKLKFSRP